MATKQTKNLKTGNQMKKQIEKMITELGTIATLTERKAREDMVRPNIVWFKNITDDQADKATSIIEACQEKTGDSVKYWIEEDSGDNFDLMIKF